MSTLEEFDGVSAPLLLHDYQRAWIDSIKSQPERSVGMPGFLRQPVGRALRVGGRVVHAQRARKLRRRGEVVRFIGLTSTGKAMYRWMTASRVLIVDVNSEVIEAALRRKKAFQHSVAISFYSDRAKCHYTAKAP